MANASEVLLPQFPNPFTPDAEYQRTITTYVLVGMLSVLVWDILTHLRADYKLTTRSRLNLPTIVYHLSRWSSLLYTTASTVFETAPLNSCVVLGGITCTVYHLAVSSTALLFFFRVRAIFNNNKYITIGFSTLWITVLGGSLSTVTSLPGMHIGTTKYCMFSTFKPSRGTANVAIALFDTCVFAAITWRLSNSPSPIRGGGSRGSKFYLLGRYLPAFSRAVLQDGQNYYLIAMVVNLLVLVMDFVKGVPVIYRVIFMAPSVGLTNIMACRVFRHTKLRGYDDEVHAVSALVFAGGNNTPVFVDSQMGGLTTGSVSCEHDPHGECHGYGRAPSDYYSTDKLTHASKGAVSVV